MGLCALASQSDVTVTGGDDTGSDGPAAEHGVAAERLDRADFVMWKPSNIVPIYWCGSFQPPAERQAVGQPTKLDGESMKSGGVDPEYQRYRRTHPRFPGVSACVELLRRRNVQGAYLDGVMGDLQEHAGTHGADLLAAFRAEVDGRVRVLLLSIIAETPSPAALGTFSETLFGEDEDLRIWAARGLHILGTPEARTLLWDARSKQFSDPTATARFQEMLSEVGRWKRK